MKKEESRFTDSAVFEGMTSIRAVISASENKISDRKIEKLLIDEEKKKNKGKEIAWLNFKAGEMNFQIQYVSADILDKYTTGSTHGGIIALCSERTIPSLNESDIKKDGFYAMLEGIEDPYNFGYAVRALYVCGIDGIILTPRNWMSAAGVVCRSSAGTSELLPCFVSEGTEAAKLFKKQGYKIICAGIRDSISSFECDMTKPVFLIIGGEKRGISSALLSEADRIVRIDYDRQFGGSLSAASAASMLAYEIMKQNKLKQLSTNGDA
jgi:23S rRNA (guanosine2251-2'-O)-methyltransferase